MAQPKTYKALLSAMDAFLPTLADLCTYLWDHNCDPLANELEEAFMDVRDMLAGEDNDAD